MSLPTIHGEARIVGQPEMRATPAGKNVLQARVVANRRKLNEQTQQWENTAEAWLNLAMWDKLAERNDGYLNDKDIIVFEGELEVRQYDRKDGTKGTSVDVRVTNVAKVAPYVNGGQSAPARQPASVGGNDPWGSTSSDIPF